MKKAFLIILVSLLLGTIAAENIDDMIFDNDSKADDDIIKVNFEKKDARRAMLFSAILPGAGQFYADKSAFTTYLFPVLEIAMIGGIIYFNQQGDNKTDDYEFYADGETVTQTFNYTVDGVDYEYTYTGTRYNRTYQNLVQTVLSNVNAYDIYDGSFFRLDAESTQHFYEDIGKYNKYIFGWGDWFHRFATDPTSGNGTFVLDDPTYDDVWIWSGSTDPQLIHKRRWEQNYTVEDFMNNVLTDPVRPESPEASPWRQEYIDMRNAAKKQYSYGRLFTLGLAFNHIASAVDAVMVTNRYNRNALTQNKLQMYYYTDLGDNSITPMCGLSYHF